MTTSQSKTELRQIMILAIPAVIAQLAQMGLGVVDVIMAGHYSAEALAAIAVGTNLFIPLIVFVSGLLVPLNPMVAQLNGKENWSKIRQLFQNGMMLALLLAIPCIFILRSLEPLLVHIGIDSALIPLIQGYLDAISWGMPAMILFLALRFANEGLFSNKAIMYIALATLPLNIVMNYWFVYGGLGIEAMGAVGVGWATDVVYSFMLITLALFTARTRRYSHLKVFSNWSKPDLATINETLLLGIPMAFTMGLEVTLFAVIGIMIGTYSVVEIGGHQIAMNISSLTYMMPLGISLAITARVGFHIGRNDPRMAKKSGYIGIKMSFAIMLINCLLLVSFPTLFASLYSEDHGVIAVASQLLLYAAFFQLSDGLQVASTGALRGVKDTKVPLYISLVAYWLIAYPIGYWLAEKQGYGVKGYWIALNCGLLVSAILLTTRFVKLIKRKIHEAEAEAD